MPGRKGVLAPQNSFLDTIATRFDGTQSCFLLGSAQVPGVYHIVYCSDGFCTLTGHPRAQVMQKSCSCDFLFGHKTDHDEQKTIWRSLSEKKEYQSEISLYKKDGTIFECLLDIVPIRNQNRGVVMFLVSLKDVTPQPESTDEHSETEKPFLMTTDEISAGKKDSDSSWHSLGESERMSCIPAQRRRSRAVLYNLSGHIDGTSNASRINSCGSISSIFSGTGRQVLEYKTNFTDKNTRFTILHYSIAKTAWDWLILIFTLYVATVVPYYAALQALDPTYAFRNSTDPGHIHGPTYTFDIFLEFVFIVDIAFNFRTTFVNKRGQLVADPKEIALNYLKSTFIIDLIAAVPFDFISHVFAVSWAPSARTPIQLLKTVRLLRVFKLYKKIDSWSQYRLVVLLMLMLMFGMVAHWMACIWFSIGWTEFNKAPMGTTDGTGWIFELSEAMHRPFFSNKTGGPGVQSAYLTSLYFTLSSLTSVGFGNVSANTNAEKTFSICVMIVGAIMHAVVFGSITAIIQRMYEKRSEFDRKERNLNDFIRIHRFPKDLKRRMTNTFQGKWAMNKGVNEKEVVTEFPEDLQADISIHLHRDLLNLPIFRNMSEGCRRFASLHSSRRFVAPNNTFVHAGDPLEYVFLVCSGSLEVSKNDIVSAILSKGDLFGGDVSSDTVVISRANVKALTFCELQCISLGGLKKIAEIYPKQCDIMEDLRADFSCQLWEETILDMKELQKQRTTKIESWNKHYNIDDHEESQDASDSDSSCIYFPAVTMQYPHAVPKTEIVVDEETGNATTEVKDEDDDEIQPELEEVRIPSRQLSVEDKSASETTDASPVMKLYDRRRLKRSGNDCHGVPCLRQQAKSRASLKRCNSTKKRVSFHDEEEMNSERQEKCGNSPTLRFAETLTVVNEIPSCDSRYSPRTSMEETLSSAPESPYSPIHYNSFFGSCSPLSSPVASDSSRVYPTSGRDRSPTVIRESKFRDHSPNSLTAHCENSSAKSSPLSGVSSEIRKRRRRRKMCVKIDPKDRRTSSSSVEEELSKQDHAKERQRKSSVVELVRKEDFSSNCLSARRRASPDRSSPERDCRLQRLEEKFDNFYIMVLNMAANIDRILVRVNEMTPQNSAQNHDAEEDFQKKSRNLQVPGKPRSILRRQRSSSSQDILSGRVEAVLRTNGSSSLDNLRRHSDVAAPILKPKSPDRTTTEYCWKRPIPKRPDECRSPLMRRGSSFRILVPSRGCSPVPNQDDSMRRTDDGQNRAGYNQAMQISRSHCVGNCVEHQAPIQTLAVPQPNKLFYRQSSVCTPDEQLVSFHEPLSRHHRCEDDSASTQGWHSPRKVAVSHSDSTLNGHCDYSESGGNVLLATNRRHMNLPTIAISNYDEEFENVDSAPKRNHSPRRSMTHLSIPISCQNNNLSIPMNLHGRGSESGYSTSSPSPEIHVLDS